MQSNSVLICALILLPQVLNEGFLPTPRTCFTLNSVPASVPLQSFCLANGCCISAGGQGCFDTALAHGNAPKLSVTQQYLKGQVIGQKWQQEYIHILFTAFLN